MEYVRLLLCLNEKTIDELPDYEGNPEYDTILEYLISEKHTNPSGEPHVGNLIRIPKKYWDDPNGRKEIEKQIKEGVLGPGLNEEFYNTRDTFREDAMTCWIRDHNRDPACSDYRSDKKLLVPNTKAERKDLGMPKYERSGAPKRWLCNFCPVESLVQQSQRAKAGMYK